EDDDLLLLDLDGLAALWATELTYPQLRIAGIVYNELRTAVEVDPSLERGEGFQAQPERGPGGPDPEPGRADGHDGRTMRRPRHIHTRRSPMTPQAEISIQDQDLAALATSPPFASEEGQPVDHISIRETGQWFRRTYVRRGRASVR